MDLFLLDIVFIRGIYRPIYRGVPGGPGRGGSVGGKNAAI